MKIFSTYTSRHRQGKVSSCFGICLYDCFIYRSNFLFRKCLEARRHLGSCNSEYPWLLAIHCFLTGAKMASRFETFSEQFER